MTITLPRWDERSFTDWRRWVADKFVEPRAVWSDRFDVARDRWTDLFTTPDEKQHDNDHITFMMMLVAPISVEVYDIVDGVEVNRRPADLRRFDR